MYLIYCYTNKINNKKYIGITRRTLEQREKNHISEAYNYNSPKYHTPFKCAIRKYGIDNFDKVILDTAIDIEEANKKEKQYIEKYRTYCYGKNNWGYNATKGGDGVARMYRKIVQLNKNDGKLIKIFETISEAEAELNISHISECLHNKIPSIGGYCWMYLEQYKTMDQKNIFDYIQIKNNRIVQLSKEGRLIKIWNSALEASKELKCHEPLIIKVCKGSRKTHNNFCWKFYSDYIYNINPKPVKIKICQYDDQNKILNIYNSIKEAALANNIIPQVLGRHIDTNKIYKDSYWYRKEVSTL